MPTTAELRELVTAGEDIGNVGHVLVMDGIEPGFTDHHGLVGIDTGGGHDVRLGLTREGLSFRIAGDLRTGQFLDSPLKCTIVDFEGDLAALWRSISDDVRQLGDVPIGAGAPIAPDDDLSGRTELHGMHIGLEQIGPAGERHQFPVPPDYAIGHAHAIGQPELDLEGAPVSANPVVWTGRRIALYRCYRDHITYPNDATQGWRPFSEAVRLWWGTMRDAGEVQGREWAIECDGPESWLRKPLGVGYQPRGVPEHGVLVGADTTLSAEQSQIGILLITPGGGVGFENWGFANFTYTITGTTPSEILADVQAAILDIASVIGGVDGIFNDQPGCHVEMTNEGGVQINVDPATPAPATLHLCIHREVWTVLGYDIEQAQAVAPDYEDPRAVPFSSSNALSDFSDAPPGYVIGHFPTGGWRSPSPETETDTGGLTNDGNTRFYTPWYANGAFALLADPTKGGTVAGQVVRIGDAILGVNTSSSTVAHPGQLDRPVASDPSDPQAAATIPGVGNCTRQGVWALFGKRRFASTIIPGTEQILDEVQWVRASWQGAGGLQQGLVASDVILVTEYLGIARTRMTTNWVARVDAPNPETDGMIRALPVLMFGYRPDADRADIVLQRLLLTSGTSAGWSSFASDPVAGLDPGDNDPGGTAIVLDAELAELGLGIPASMIAPVAEWSEAVDRVEPPSILNVKVGVESGYQAEDLCRALMQPVGWAWQLRNGRYGVWCPADAITLADVTVVLDRSVKTARYRDQGRRVISQELRKWQPVDKWKIDSGWQPHLSKATTQFDRQSPDSGFRYRPGEVTQNVLAHFYRNQFADGITQRLGHVARFWTKRHFEVKGYPVPMLGVGEEIWLGTIVRLTDPELVDPIGEYAVVNRIAIVTSCTTTMGINEGTKTVDLLVLADRSSTPRLHAPSAQAYGYNSATRLMSVRDNWLGIEADGWSDAAGFVEPTYDGIVPYGGDAVVVWWQWDGDTWSQTGSGTVDAVVTTPGAATLHFSAPITGTYYRDMDTIVVLAPTTTANAAWVDALYAPICDDAGEWTDVATPTDGYPWET